MIFCRMWQKILGFAAAEVRYVSSVYVWNIMSGRVRTTDRRLFSRMDTSRECIDMRK